MEIKFLSKEFRLVGAEGKIGFNEDFSKTIENLQKKLFNKINDIQNIINPDSYTAYWFYKSNCYSENQEPDVYYFAAVETNEKNSDAHGLVTKIIPKSNYAVFNEIHRGEVGGASGYGYKVWFPASGEELNEAVPGDLEVYKDINEIGPNSKCKIYIPII